LHKSRAGTRIDFKKRESNPTEEKAEFSPQASKIKKEV